MAKLVRCGRGRILDVAVDLRRGSPTYAQWEGVELDDESMRELYVPVGFAHGFCVLSEVADVLYKQTAYYDPALERAIAWNDPEVGDRVAPAARRADRLRARPQAPRGSRRWPASCPSSGILKRMHHRFERLRERTNGFTVTPASTADRRTWRSARSP